MKDGGQAFPVPPADAEGHRSGVPGMTMRQFYKAHAPEAPEYFNPNMPPCPELVKMVQDGDDPEVRDAADDFYFGQPLGKYKPETVALIKSRQEENKAIEQQAQEWRNRLPIEKAIQWPSFYADALLTEDAQHEKEA